MKAMILTAQQFHKFAVNDIISAVKSILFYHFTFASLIIMILNRLPVHPFDWYKMLLCIPSISFYISLKIHLFQLGPVSVLIRSSIIKQNSLAIAGTGRNSFPETIAKGNMIATDFSIIFKSADLTF